MWYICVCVSHRQKPTDERNERKKVTRWKQKHVGRERSASVGTIQIVILLTQLRYESINGYAQEIYARSFNIAT